MAGAGRDLPQDSPTKLTEFAPLTPEDKQSGNFISRFFSRKKDGGSREVTPDRQSEEVVIVVEPSQAVKDPSQADAASIASSSSLGALTPTIRHADLTADGAEEETPVESLLTNQPQRTLSSVLKRVTSILDRRGQTPKAYKDSDFRQYWMPDSNCKECYECGDRFNTFRRRHHCRVCGQIFCSRCCNQEVSGRIMGYTGNLRVCTYCCKIVLKYAQSSATSSGSDLQSLCEEFKYVVESEATPYGGQRQSSLMEDYSYQRSSSSPDLRSPSFARTPFDVTPQSEYKKMDFPAEQEIGMLAQDQLRQLWQLIQHPAEGVEMQTYTRLLKTYQNCIRGRDLVDWLLAKDKAASRMQAVAIGQALMAANWIECISNPDQIFRDDFAMYKPGKSAQTIRRLASDTSKDSLSRLDDNSEPQWLRDIEQEDSDNVSVSEEMTEENLDLSHAEEAKEYSHGVSSRTSIFYVDHPNDLAVTKDTTWEHIRDRETTSATNMATEDLQQSTMSTMSEDFLSDALSLPGEMEESNVQGSWDRDPSSLQEETGERLAYERISKGFKEHIENLTKQMLSQAGLSNKWTETIISLAHKVTKLVTPDIKHSGDDMDIRKYVQVKKVPGGLRSNSTIVAGVVCTKNVAHKKMRTLINNPKVLLLQGPVEYQRVENKYTSLEPQILQEREFLQKLIQRISELKPDVLLVEKSVSRVAQNFLLDSGVTLVLNVKNSVMRRVARLTQGDIVMSVDGLVNKTSLGFCQRFCVKTHELQQGERKTLMYFDGCGTRLGCTITLRGGSKTELLQVKKILRFVIYATYHSRLETSFLMDEFAIPPALQMEQNSDLAIPDKASSENNTNHSKESEDALSGESSKRNSGSTVLEELSVNVSLDNSSSSLSPGEVSRNSSSPKPWASGTPSPNSKKIKRSSTKELDSTAVEDFSDPLHNYQKSQDDSIFKSTVSLKEEVKNTRHKLKKALCDIILSSSPLVHFSVPYLETEAGSQCKLRKHFQKTLYWSAHFTEEGTDRKTKLSDSSRPNSGLTVDTGLVYFAPIHPFVSTMFTTPASDLENQALLADYRARGGQIKFKPDLSQLSPPYTQYPETASKSHNKDYLSTKVDCLDPFCHQRIGVLFSSFSYDSPNAPEPCVYPWVVNMDYYGCNDLTLGSFLDKYCFRENYACPSPGCDTPMVNHVRRFVHGTMCVQIFMKHLDTPMPHYHDNILMWGWCRRCKQVTPVLTMSQDTWSMSFAKYLELRFYAEAYNRRTSTQPCQHSLHHEHFQYFGYKHTVASFKYNQISLREIALPHKTIGINEVTMIPDALSEEVKQIFHKGTYVFNQIIEQLFYSKSETQNEHQATLLTEYIVHCQADKAEFVQMMDKIQMLMQACHKRAPDANTGAATAHCVSEVEDQLVLVKHMLTEKVAHWNIRIQELEQLPKRLEKTKGFSTVSSASKLKDMPSTAEASTSSEQVRWFASPTETAGDIGPDGNSDSSENQGPTIVTPKLSSHRVLEVESLAAGTTPGITAVWPGHLASSATHDGSLSEKTHLQPPATSKPRCDSSSELGGVADASADGSPLVVQPGTTEGPKKNNNAQKVAKLDKAPNKGSAGGGLADLDKPDLFKKGSSKKNIFSSFLSGSDATFIQPPFGADEHYLQLGNDSVPIIIYDQEPSSIIAYALSSQDYERELLELTNQSNKESFSSSQGSRSSSGNPANEQGGKKNNSMLSFLRGDRREKSPNRQSSGFSVESVKYTPGLSESLEEDSTDGLFDTEKTKASKQGPNNHIELQFGNSTAKFYCRVYYAQQFQQLRSLIFPHGEERYIRSLSRCITWLARGGKSGSSFCKTQDDRFILKQMSAPEEQSFVKFAPDYIQYITKTHNEKRPTALAKIVGVYRIGYRNSKTNAALKQDLLVMENLFYGRNITQIFDLKGSMKNRLVKNTKESSSEDLVLLDENLLKASLDDPLYIRWHSKRVLNLAIMSDSQFLSSHHVMDYSLLVGVDDSCRELVIGIIDYIRTFTWDKKLEMVWKTGVNALGGASGKMPTVVFPELYRSRFLEAMDKYFQMVPDRWTGLENYEDS